MTFSSTISVPVDSLAGTGVHQGRENGARRMAGRLLHNAASGGWLKQTRTRKAESLRDDTTGAIFVEYLTLASMVTIGGAAAVVTLGTPLLNLYDYVELVILLPIP